MSNCRECSNAIFDAVWGEIKCSVWQHRIYDPDKVACSTYKKGTPKESKANANYEANLHDS